MIILDLLRKYQNLDLSLQIIIKITDLLFNVFIMKKSLFIILLVGALTISWCGWQNGLKKYNDSIYTSIKECTDSTQILFENYEKSDGSITVDSIMQILEEDISICQKSENEVKSLGDYDGDSSLTDAASKLLWLEISYLQKFWSTSHYWNIDSITDEDMLQYNWIVDELNELEDALNAQFLVLQQTQEGFAAKHGLILDTQVSEE